MAFMYSSRRILVIAGSDSSGGAGLEADQKVIAAHGCYAMTATTALTAQNTVGVDAIHVTPSDFVARQIHACASDVHVDVVKTGMLACADTIKVVVDAIKEHDLYRSVVDPVMIASHGARLLPEDAIHTVIEELLPVTFLLTPNIPEAILLLSESGHNLHSVRSLADIKQLAKALAGLGPKHVLVKGGHLPLSRTTLFAAEAGISDYEKVIANVLYSSPTDEFHVVMTAYHTSSSTHGTGCSLASAIACQMASSHALVPAIANALDYVEAGIRLAKPLGHGVGPINHFHSIQIMPFAPGNFINYLLRHPLVRPAWKRFTNHPFVCGLSDGTLPRKSFKHYMVQDYLYLTQFARANALAGFKATELQTIGAAAEIVLTIQRETALHLAECEEMGIGRIALEFAREDPACTAYTRYILDVGMQQDYFALQMAMLPCLLGYAYIAARLTEQQPDYIPRSGRASEGARLIAAVRLEAEHEYGNEMHDLPPPMNGGKGENPYRKWIDNYCSDTYVEAVAKGCALAEKYAAYQSPARIKELVDVFFHATTMETAFWDMGWRAGREK